MRSDAALTEGFAAARAICRRRIPAINLPIAFLPCEKRQGVCAVLALCEMIRDASVGSADIREMLSDRLGQLAGGTIDLPSPEVRSEDQHALFAAAQTIRRFGIPPEWFADFARALQSEMPRYATWDSLAKHLQGTGGSIAKIVAAVLGMTHSDGAQRAVELGVAIELTRIVCNLRGSLDQGVVLLPLADLAQARYTERDLLAHVVDGRFEGLIRSQIARARERYDHASQAILWLADDGSRIFAALVIATARSALDATQQRWRDLFSQNRLPSITTMRIIRQLPGAWNLARRATNESQ